MASAKEGLVLSYHAVPLDHVGSPIVGLRLSTFRINVRLAVRQKCHPFRLRWHQLADHAGPSNSGRPATPAVLHDQLSSHLVPTRFQSTPSWCRTATRPRPERPPSSHKARLWAYHAKLECRRDSDWFQGDQSGFAPATTCSSCSALVDYRLATLVVSPPGQLDLASATSSLALHRRIRGATPDACSFPSWIRARQLSQQTRITKRFRRATTTRRCNTKPKPR